MSVEDDAMRQPPGSPHFVTRPELHRTAQQCLPCKAWNFYVGSAAMETTRRPFPEE
jgi:nitrate reductase cytochrome c-type subunit